MNEKGVTIKANLQSDENGKVTASGLAPGKYKFVETKAPAGYLLNTEGVTFRITEKNKGKVQTVSVGKYTNYKGAFKIEKVNTSGKNLAGAVFALYNADKQSMGITKTSNASGVVKFDNLAPGTYYFKETKAPTLKDGSDYVINPALIKVEVQKTAKGSPTTVDFGDFQNFKGRAQVTKVGEGSSIAGAKFNLFKLVNGEKQLEKKITVPSDGKLNLNNLGSGSYQLIETKAAKGYIINSQPIYFVVNDNDDENPVIDNLDFPNYLVEIHGKKVDQHGKGIKGANYSIYKATSNNKPTGKKVEVINESGKEVTTITSNTSGEIYAKGMEVGRYVLIETKAPKGYIKDTTPHPFTIKEQTGKPKIISLSHFVNYQGSAKLVKINERGKRLHGATFKVINTQGKTIQSGLKSDEKGQVIIKELAPGTYRFVETKAPTGYVLNTKQVSFKINATNSGKVQTIAAGNFANYKGSAELKKVDKHNKGLKGATFKVVNASSKKIVKKVLHSDASGKIKVTNLSPGRYTFVETKAPTGYKLSKKTIEFTINQKAAGNPVIVKAGKLVNKKETDPTAPSKPEKGKHISNNKHGHTTKNSGEESSKHKGFLPSTGDSEEVVFTILGSLLVVLFGVQYFRKRKN